MTPVATASATSARILVVDDELGPRESLRMLLKAAYQVQVAESGRSALALLPQAKPDIVILDIKMPDMDGLEVLRRLKHADPTLEVIMITAYASLETVKLALTHGAFEYLIKPFSRQDLEDVVRRAVARRQADLGAKGEVTTLVEQMRELSGKTRELEEAARREQAEQSLRVTQLSLLRQIARTIVGQLAASDIITAVTEQLRVTLGYDKVGILPAAPAGGPSDALVVCVIRDAEGTLGHLVVDNRASGRPVDPRERELLEMLSEYLAIALRNSRLYGEIATTKRSLEHLIASAGEGIIAVDPGDRINGWNPAAERIFGFATGQALGRPITHLLPAAEYAAAKERLARGASMQTFEANAVGDRDPAVALAVTLSGLRGASGALEGLIAIVRDITAQREVEAQLHQSEKLTALGQLAGGIAHDFNNLLQAILGYAQLMKQNIGNPELLERSLSVVENAAMDGSETVRRIQTFARLRPEERFMPLSVNTVVEDALAITRPRWEEKIAHDRRPLKQKLELRAQRTIRGRSAALAEVMTNLILNAIDAMPDGGTLTVATRDTADGVAITVSDTGVGMPERVRRRIFEPFFSTKGEAGSGLGLSMAYSIVRRHGGDIRVDSEPGKGTTFTLTLPESVELAPPEPRETRNGARRAARILLVDDDPQVLSALVGLLEGVGHSVDAAVTGAAALRAYDPGRFDVVLTNVGMAGMNGWEFAERLRAVDMQVPMLFLTGWGLREEDQARLGALKVERCLFKPVRPEELDAAIQAAISPAR
ncbi:MAG TPA: response regulator [Methylomirabilota bacterium]|nr:response regulator [Methylomirabilota bacterium]